MPGQEKTEPATPRRRQEMRQKGNVARSAEVSTVAGLLVGLIFLRSFGPGLCQQLADTMRFAFGHLSRADLTMAAVQSKGLALVLSLAASLAPLLAGLLVVGIAVNAAQVGFLFTARALIPDLSRLNPLSGLGRMFSRRALVELLKALLKVSLSGYIAYSLVRDRYEMLLNTPGMALGESVGALTGVAIDMATNMTVILLALALLDYGYQRWQYEQSIKMTREEVREEMRQSETSPQMRARIRQRQRAIAMRRMMRDVPKADVVITNPTHLAVALQYTAGQMRAPRVVAKGERLMAERIKAVAREHGVPVVENKPLAQALFRTVEIGQEISPDLYQAVAEVLAFIYRLKRQGAPATNPVAV